MINLTGELGAAERVVLAIDTSEKSRAQYLAQMARDAGASIIKQGLELSSVRGLGWEFCAENAAENGLDWVADAKLDDIPTTVAHAVVNIASQDHPPLAITVHCNTGVVAMREAQAVAADKGIVLLGVTELTSKEEAELKNSYGFFLSRLGIDIDLKDIEVRKPAVHMHARNAHIAGIGGLVASPRELQDPIGIDPDLSGKITMIPGSRSAGEDTHDQQNAETPRQAIIDGATLLVIGRQVTKSEQPEKAMAEVVTEIQEGLDARGIA